MWNGKGTKCSPSNFGTFPKVIILKKLSKDNETPSSLPTVHKIVQSTPPFQNKSDRVPLKFFVEKNPDERK